MYRYYSYFAVCYTYLSDVRWIGETRFDARLAIETYQISLTSFKERTWFSGGWTLQELLAPNQVLFFDRTWDCIGERNELAQHISPVTRISKAMLRDFMPDMPGHRTQLIIDAPVAEKMSWAVKRCTSGEEDMACCLLGLFDVNMPLLYGEGSKAFMRLQLETVRKSADESNFAWRREGLLSTNITKTLLLKSWERAQVQTYFQQNEARNARERADYKPGTFFVHSGLLAQQAADFLGSGHIKWGQRRKFVKRMPYSMTN